MLPPLPLKNAFCNKIIVKKIYKGLHICERRETAPITERRTPYAPIKMFSGKGASPSNPIKIYFCAHEKFDTDIAFVGGCGLRVQLV